MCSVVPAGTKVSEFALGRWEGCRSRLLSGKPDEWMHLLPFYTRMHGAWLRYAKSTSQYSLVISLKARDDCGFQVNPLCRHDITSPFPPSGNEGYVRNREILCVLVLVKYMPNYVKTHSQ